MRKHSPPTTGGTSLVPRPTADGAQESATRGQSGNQATGGTDPGTAYDGESPHFSWGILPPCGLLSHETLHRVVISELTSDNFFLLDLFSIEVRQPTFVAG